MEASREFARRQNEHEEDDGDLSRFIEPVSDHDLKIFMEAVEDNMNGEAGEESKSHGKMKDLTPEIVFEKWNGLSDLEKKFVAMPQASFDNLIDTYQEKYGPKKTSLVKALHKLILTHHPLISLIAPEKSK